MPPSLVPGRSVLSRFLHPVVWLCAFACATVVRAHREIEAGLSRLNPLIEASPQNAGLYLERGELYAQHEDWVQAEANYLRAAELAPGLTRLDRLRGALALRTGDPRAAAALFDRALRQDPRDAESYILRSRLRAGRADRAGALADLNTALGLIANPRPELFLDRAALMPSATLVIASLDAGIAQIGPAHTLHLRALELEESAGLLDAAVARTRALAARSERRELWLKRGGDILVRAGRRAEARAAYSAALTAAPRRSGPPSAIMTGRAPTRSRSPACTTTSSRCPRAARPAA